MVLGHLNRNIGILFFFFRPSRPSVCLFHTCSRVFRRKKSLSPFSRPDFHLMFRVISVFFVCRHFRTSRSRLYVLVLSYLCYAFFVCHCSISLARRFDLEQTYNSTTQPIAFSSCASTERTLDLLNIHHHCKVLLVFRVVAVTCRGLQVYCFPATLGQTFRISAVHSLFGRLESVAGHGVACPLC